MTRASLAAEAPIEGKDQLIAQMESGGKPDPSHWRIGCEHEKFVYDRRNFAPLSYEGEDKRPGIRHILEGFVEEGWEPVLESGKVIATKRAGASVTLEPAGQFELSGAPLETIHQTCSETSTHLETVKALGERFDIGFFGMGYHPLIRREDARVMPKGRYDIMRGYMPKVGNQGLDMMLRTCTVQVNLDFADEADMVEKFRIALALQPIATALFASSPFKEGRITEYKSLRSHAWTDTDPDRTGMLPFAFENGFGFERYVDYVLDVPMYCVYRNGRYINCAGKSFRDFMAGRLDALPGERPLMRDWVDHMGFLFPEARVKTFIEMRGADGGPWARLCALPAFWVGLLYDAAAQREASALIADWTKDERQQLRDDVPREALQTRFKGRSVRDWAADILAIADRGLARRGRFSAAGDSEQIFLRSLHESVESGETPADVMIRQLRDECDGDMHKLIKLVSY